MPSRILVVDDDLSLLRAITAALEPLGSIVPAEDARGALRHLEEREPIDLLVCDLHLPDLSGIEVIARARARVPGLPALLLTGQAEPGALIEAINRAEVYRFLPKPIDLDDLARTARTALEAVELRRERERLHAELGRSHAALRVLYDATRDLAQARGRAEIVTAALSRLARGVPFELGALLHVPEGAVATLYLHAAAPSDEITLVRFKEETLGRFAALGGRAPGEHDVRLVLLGAQVASQPPAPASVETIDAPLQAGGETIGIVRLQRGAMPFEEEERRILGVLCGHASQALTREEELAQSQRRQLELLLSSMADGVVMLGDDGDLLLANRAARAMLDLPSMGPVAPQLLRDRLGFGPFDVVRGWERAGADVRREEIRSRGRTLHTIVSPVLDGAGALAGVSVVLRDLTAEKELEHQKEEFVSVVSHELRTPLTSLSGCLDLLLRGYVGDVAAPQRRYVQLARDSCDKLNAIVDDLLDLSKYERGRLEVSYDEVELTTLCRDVVERHQPAAQERGIRLSWANGMGARVAGDATRLTQVLDNLLSNALKFTAEGGAIEVGCLAADAPTDHVGVAVWNSGPPLGERELERIFEKFRQGEVGRRSSKGTGLGLAIARGLVETHGGRLWAENAQGGVRFVAVLPRLAGTPGPPELDEPTQGALQEALGARSLRPILVADSDPGTAALLKGVLLRYGLTALTATTADETLALARHRGPALALLDPRLTGGDGALLQILAHDPETREIPILHTGLLDAASCLPRPFASIDLLREVARALRTATPAVAPFVLLVDSDPEIRRGVATALAAEGCRVSAHALPEPALAEARALPPDLAILEVELHGPDGFELARALGAGRPGGPELILLTARAALNHKVRAFREGASDYLLKPVDPAGLAERARAALRRRDTRAGATPTTRLPGSYAIEREIRRRIASREPFACMHVTVDQIREFNEAYGYGKAEGVIQQVGDLVREVLRSASDARDFAGHVQRDHFVVITQPERADAIGEALLGALNRVLPLYYDREDRTRGFLKLTTPEGTRLAPLMSGCVVAILQRDDRFMEPAEIFTAARLARQRGKAPGRPAYLRNEGPPASGEAR